MVLTAQAFNPSIFNEVWLDRNDVVPSALLKGFRVFSPEVAQFETSDLQVLIIPPKMQVTFPMERANADGDLPQRILTRTVELLPQTPFRALGLNFEYFVVPPSEQEFLPYNHSLFREGKNNLDGEFGSNNSLFGRYYSANRGIFRLKLDIKPGRAGEARKEVMHFSFNFDFDVSDIEPNERVRKLGVAIRQWGELGTYARRLVDLGSSPVSEEKGS